MKIVALTADPSRVGASALVRVQARLLAAAAALPGAGAGAGAAVRLSSMTLEPSGRELVPASLLPDGMPSPHGALLAWLPDLEGTVLDEVMADAGLDVWLAVEEYVQAAGDPAREADAGRVTRFGLVRRARGRTRAEFRMGWVDVHGPLVLKAGPMFDRYVANIPTDPAAPWDGIVEQGFADMAAWEEHDRQILEEKQDVHDDLLDLVDGYQQFVGRHVATIDSALVVRRP